jgi:integrase
MGEGVVDANPIIGTNKAPVEGSRDRVLSNDELAAVWCACRNDDYGRIVRLLILTGQRREEVAGLTFNEIDLAGRTWIIPKHRSKNGREHEVPLSSLAVDVLSNIPIRQERLLVFGEGTGGFSGWSKAKAALDKRIAASGQQVKPWRLHDLRRSLATGVADQLGTLPHVVEAILNHVSGYKAGVAGVYNRAAYREEKRQALERWAKHIHGLIGSGE